MPELASSPTDTTPRSSRERIDAAALRLLAERGYAGLSMQSLADAVGLHKSTLFHHYKSKSEIAEGVVARVMQRMLDHAVPRLTAPEPDLDHYIAFAHDLCDYFCDEPEASKVLLRVVLAPAGSPLQITDPNHAMNKLLVLLVDWFQRARDAGSIRYVRVRHVLFDLMGVVVFHPAVAPQLMHLAGPTPFSPSEREKRKREMAAFLRGALCP